MRKNIDLDKKDCYIDNAQNTNCMPNYHDHESIGFIKIGTGIAYDPNSQKKLE